MNHNQVDELIRVMLVDDHPAVRQGLGLLLSSEGIAVCAEASTGDEALVMLVGHRPDVAIVDLSLGPENALAFIEELHARQVPVLVYSMHEDANRVEAAFAAGALGYVSKREMQNVLVQAIRAVSQGRRFVSPGAAAALAEHVVTIQFHSSDRELSEQERQVYRLLGEGEGTVEIASTMGISARTVESYYERIREKLRLSGMRELRRHAINHLHEHDS